MIASLVELHCGVPLRARHRSLTAGRAACHSPDALSSRDVHSSAGGISSWHKRDCCSHESRPTCRHIVRHRATTTMFLHVAASLGMIDSNDNLPTDCQPTTFNPIQPVFTMVFCAVQYHETKRLQPGKHNMFCTHLWRLAPSLAQFFQPHFMVFVPLGHLFYSDRFGPVLWHAAYTWAGEDGPS